MAGFVKFLDGLPPDVVTVKSLSPEELERMKQELQKQPFTITVREAQP